MYKKLFIKYMNNLCSPDEIEELVKYWKLNLKATIEEQREIKKVWDDYQFEEEKYSFKRVNFSDGGKAGKRPLCINLIFIDFRKKGLLPALPPSEKFFVHRIDRSLSGAEGESSFLSDTN